MFLRIAPPRSCHRQELIATCGCSEAGDVDGPANPFAPLFWREVRRRGEIAELMHEQFDHGRERPYRPPTHRHLLDQLLWRTRKHTRVDHLRLGCQITLFQRCDRCDREGLNIGDSGDGPTARRFSLHLIRHYVDQQDECPAGASCR
jgi:hypothetical protein